ncbi:MAG: fibronectin type III domain-containing protein [Eubacterium sp.]|nr:fibronectin type III domain-containing protein [Eubacterium sp.]
MHCFKRCIFLCSKLKGEKMKKSITKALAVFMSLMLVLMSAFPAMAENSSEVEAYLNSTYAKAIDPYGSLKKDDEGRYIIPLSKTSVSLKKDTSSKLYTSSWSSSDDTYAKVTNSSYSASAKITHPSYNEGAKVVTLTLKILDKTDGKTVLGTRDYVLYIETKLATYSLDVTAKNEKGEIIDNAKVSVFDSRNIEQNPSSLSANTEYTLTVSALGYVRDVRKITLTQNTKLDFILKEGATVDFTVKLATGAKTDYATLKVTSADGSQTYSPIKDEYGYETSQFELTPGEYKYYATYQSGSQTAAGTFTVAEGAKSLNITVNLKYTEYKVKFDVTPENAKITLKKNGSSGAYGDEILPDENGYYTIVYGQYRYTAQAEGFITVSKTFNATDTSLKNNNYVITVKLDSLYDSLLNKADDYLFAQSGDGMMMTEFSGVHTDGDFGYVSDVDSDYQDTNVIETVEEKINSNVKSDEKITVKLNAVKNIDGDDDNTVIFKNGNIYYNGVDSSNYDEDFYGAVYDLSLTLTCGDKTKESEVRVVVPYHTYTRLQRLDSAALYAVNFANIKGENKSAADVNRNLDLINTADSDDYSYYSICSSWVSDHPEIIDAKTGKVTRPEKDTMVKLTVKTYYSASFVEETDFFFDPGPLGDNAAYRSVRVMVKGTKQDEVKDSKPATKPSEPATTPSTTQPTTKPSTTKNTETVKPKKTSIKKLSKGKKKFTVTWAKVSGVKGYQIQYSSDKKFKKNNKSVTVTKQKTTKATVKKLKSKKKYYVRVRTYKTVNGKKIYSSWSKVKSVKTK